MSVGEGGSRGTGGRVEDGRSETTGPLEDTYEILNV